MKNILSLVILIIIGSSCANTDERVAKANVDIIKQYLEAVRTRNYNTMELLLAENYLGLGPYVGDTVNKQQALDNWKWNSENLYKSVNYEFSELLPASIKQGPTAGDWVSNWTYVTIKYRDGSGPVNIWVNAVYKIENGKIARSRTFYNVADAMGQLGYRVLPPVNIPDSEQPF